MHSTHGLESCYVTSPWEEATIAEMQWQPRAICALWQQSLQQSLQGSARSKDVQFGWLVGWFTSTTLSISRKGVRHGIDGAWEWAG